VIKAGNRSATPKNVVGFRNQLDLQSKLTADARSTGYREGDAELYIASSDENRAVCIV